MSTSSLGSSDAAAMKKPKRKPDSNSSSSVAEGEQKQRRRKNSSTPAVEPAPALPDRNPPSKLRTADANANAPVRKRKGGAAAPPAAASGEGVVSEKTAAQKKKLAAIAAGDFNIPKLWALINELDQERGDEMAAALRELSEIKKKIAVKSKQNFTLERDIRNLDKKIALLIRNRITLEEAVHGDNDISLVNRDEVLKSKKEKDLYGRMFYLLQRDTRYTASLSGVISLAEIDNLLQTIMFTLYGNQYDETEEHLLLTMFRRVLNTDIDSAPNLGSVLRANTAGTRMMTVYTRRGPGQEYLKQTLTGVMMEMCNDASVNFEINPLKVYPQMIDDYEISTGKKSDLNRKVTAEEAAENAAVVALIGPRIKVLCRTVVQFVDAMINSLETIPYGIRWICKQICVLVKERFPEITPKELSSLIGGFYLLRFVNPAVVTPQAVMQLDIKLSANAKRNLTLLAKVLQNLANNVRFGGLKEAYMEPLNDLLEPVQKRVNEFMFKLAEVPPLESAMTMDRYLALGKSTEASLIISFNEIYFIQKLLLQHRDVVFKDTPNDPLLPILDELGAPPDQLGRKENANVELILLNPLEDSEETGVEAINVAPEQLYSETKYLLFAVLRLMPKEEIAALRETGRTVNSLLQAGRRCALENKDRLLADRVRSMIKNVKELMRLGEISDDDNYERLRKDAYEELLHYDDYLEAAAQDAVKLKRTLAQVEKHQSFLQGQFEAYVQYLADVRDKCEGTPDDWKKKESKVVAAVKKDPKAPAAGSPKKPGKEKAVKYTYQQLESTGVIRESEVPKERQSSLTFLFTVVSPGTYNVAVKWKNLKQVSDLTLELSELQQLKEEGETDFVTEFLSLDINLLLHLLNKHF